MQNRYFNWKLAFAILLGILVIVVTAFGLRQWRRTTRAENGLLLGRQAYDKHNYEEAATQFGRYIAIYPNDVNALLKYADSQMKIRPLKSRNIMQALAAYRSILRTDQTNSQAALELTGLYLRVGQAGEAELIARRFTEVNKNPQVRRNLASAYVAQKNFEAAVKELKSIVSDDPTQVPAFELLGQIALQRPNDFNQTPDYWFNEAVKKNSSNALAYIARASFYRISNNRAMALADLQKAEQLDLSDLNVRLRLAAEFVSAGSLEQAEKQLLLIKQTEPHNQFLWQGWAQLALKTADEKNMRNVAQEGLKQLSDQPWDFMPLATELFIRSGEIGKAEECIKQMSQKEISPVFLTYLEGLLADHKGQVYEALKNWQRSVELGNKSLQVRIAMASAYSRLNDYQSALQQLDKLVSEMPYSFEASYMQATLMAQTGRWEEAEQKSKQALLLSPGHTGALLLNLRARSQFLARNPSAQTKEAWQNIDSELETLDQTSNGSIDVKLVKFQCALLREDISAAESSLSDLKKLYPTNAKTVLSEAILLYAKKMPEQSLSILSQSIKKFPNDKELMEYYVLLSVQNKKYEECINLMKDVLADANQPAVRRQTSLLISHVYSLWGKEEIAQNFLVELEKELPADISVKRQLLLFKKVRENPQQSQQLINLIKSIEGENGWQWRYEQAKIWLESYDFRQRYPQIVSLLKENLRSNPGDNYSNVLLADTYNKAGDFYLAASTYSEALSRSPQNIRLIVATVAAFQRANEYARADEILAQAALKKLFDPDLKRLELYSLLTRGELKPAGQILEDMLVDDPNSLSVSLALALLKIQQHQYADAETLLLKFRSQEPNSPAAIELQVEVYLRQNKKSEAIDFCNEIVHRFNNAYAYILRGRTLALQGQISLAAKDYAQAIIIEPQNAISWLSRSDFEHSIGQLENAASDIQKAVALEPNNIQIQKRAISLYLELPNPNIRKLGMNLLDKSIEANPSDYQLQILKVRTLLFDVNYPAVKQAKAILQSITEQKPTEHDSWLLLGEILLSYEKEPSEAISTALKGLAHNQNDKALLLLKARAEAIFSPTSAILTLRGILGQDSNDIEAVLLLGDTLITTGQFNNAIDFLKKQLPAFASTPYQREINLSLGRALYKSGDKQNAQQIFETLYGGEPNNPRIFLSEIRLLKDDKLWEPLRQKCILWYQQHPDNSLTVLTIAGELAATGNDQAVTLSEEILNLVLKNNPDNVEAMNALAISLSLRGQYAQATGIYNRLLELKPNNVIAINNLAWTLYQQKEYGRALELAQRGLKMAPDYIDLVDTRGLIYIQMGKLQEAVRDFNRCLELYLPNVPSRTISCYHLGQVFYKLKENQRSSDMLKQALKLNEKIGGLSPAELTDARHLLEEIAI